MRTIALLPCWTLLAATAWGQPYGFVTSMAGNRVAVVDLDADVLVGSIPVDGLPSGSTIKGGFLYVARAQANAVARIDLQTGQTMTIPVGSAPTSVYADQLFVYVTSPVDDAVTVINPSTGAVLATVPVGDAPVDSIGDWPRQFVANWGDGTISVINTASATFPVIATVPVGGFPSGLAFNASTARLYVANWQDDTVTVVNTGNLTVTATIPVCARPRGLALAPLSTRVYVACFEDGLVQAIDTGTNQVVLEAPSGAPNPLDVALGPGNQRLYVVHMTTGKSITVLDRATLVPLGAIEAPPGPVSFAGVSAQAPPLAGGDLGALLRIARGLGDAWRSWPRTPSARARRPEVPHEIVVIEDDDFVIGDWGILNETGKQQTTQELSGGVGDTAWRKTVHHGDGSADHEYRSPTGSYNPTTQGAIDSMSVSWYDKRPDAPCSVEQSVVVYQGGVAYRTSAEDAHIFGWSLHTHDGLTSDQFYDTSGGHPDFSRTGTPLTFGYRRAASGPALTCPHGIDTFRVVIHHGDPPGALTFQGGGVNTLEGWTTVTVSRAGGTLGAVTAKFDWQGTPILQTATPHCSPTSTEACLHWADGEAGPKSLSMQLTLHGDENRIETGRLRFLPIPGAFPVVKDELPVAVWPPPLVKGPLGALLPYLQAVASAWTPAWLLTLAVPASWLAVRRRRQARAGEAKPASSPASEP